MEWPRGGTSLYFRDPTVTLWSLPRLDCGRSTDEERELLLRCLGGQELPGIT